MNKYYLGFDIGGSSVKAILVKGKKIIHSKSECTPDSLQGLLNLIARFVNNLTFEIKKSEIKGVGVSVAGVLDAKREINLKSPNIKYLDNQPLRKLIEKKLNLAVKIEHDVHCFLLAEKKIGLAKDFSNVFYLTIGTGVGGAWMFNKEMYSGAHGGAGEAGHMVLELSKSWDLESLGASQFIRKQLGPKMKNIVAEAGDGNRKAVKVLNLLGKNLGAGIANIINVLDPEAVILSGGLSKGKEFIEPGIKAGIQKFVLSPEAQKTKILFSKLGDFGGALGAVFLFDK